MESDLPTREKSSSSINSRNARLSLTSDFHKIVPEKKNDRDSQEFGWWHMQLINMCEGKLMTTALAAIILIDMMATVADIDARAKHQEPPLASFVVSEVCLGIYTIELIFIFCMKGRQGFKESVVIFDLLTTLCGYLSTGQDSESPR